MIRNTVYWMAILGILAVVPLEARAESDFLEKFRYNPEFDKPKYKKYERRSRRIGNFSSNANTFSGSGNSGLFFERDRISQSSDSGLRRPDQTTQIKLKIAF